MSDKYKHNYLTSVIARIDFPNAIKDLEKGLSSKTTQVALKYFPIAEPQKIIEGTLQINPTQMQSNPTRQLTIWNFYGKDREKTLSVGENHLYVDFKNYKKYESFKKEFLDIIKILLEEYPSIQISRFGLRYINNVELDEPNPLDWNNYISDNLLKIFEVANSDEKVSRAFQVLSVVKDDMNLTFQYGMHNPDYPAAIKKKVFILDFDAYTQGAQTEAEITNNMDKFHEQIEKYFEQSIKDGLRDKMNSHG